MTPDDLAGLRRAVRLRDRCREAAMEAAARADMPITFAQGNVAYGAMAPLIAGVTSGAVAEGTLLAGLLANTLNEAMQRLHNTHAGPAWSAWTGCPTSTLCRDAAALFDQHEVQVALAAARVARGEPASGDPHG